MKRCVRVIAFAMRIRPEIDGPLANGSPKTLTMGSKNTRRNGPKIGLPHIFHVAFRTFVGI